MIENLLKKISVVLVCILLLLSGICFLFIYLQEAEEMPPEIKNDQLVVHYIDVGQGDATLIQTPAGNMLIDAGTVESIEKLCAYIDALEVKQFSYVIFTHPHSDHIGGAETILKKYTVDHVILPDAVNTGRMYERMLTAIEQEKCIVSEGKNGLSFSLGNAVVELLAPVYNDDSNLNNMSVVTKVSFEEVSFLFMGDAEAESESAMLMTNEMILDADIMKLGHHGSSTSNTEDFLKAVSPEIAIVSCGKNNDYGHPHREVVSLMGKLDIPLYRTDEHGDITIVTDGGSYTVQTKK